MFKQEDFIMLHVPLNMYTAVCALIGQGVPTIAESPKASNVNVERDTPRASDGVKTSVQENQASDGNGPTVTINVSPSDVDAGVPEVDAHGHPWNAELHASTKGTTKEGLWRMKVGVSRPDPMPGFPKDTGTPTNGADTKPAPSAASQAATEPAPAQADTSEDDEFAAFRNAAAAVDEADATAKASVPPRTWTDADLGALCNQAAVKLGDPDPVRALIAEHIPEGVVAHSRNIPEESRETFAKAVEAKAGIEFAG
jgi:hypothetical protein